MTDTATSLVAENPIFAISERVTSLRAAGVDVISLAVGEPEVPTADIVLEAAVAAVRDRATHHYGTSTGIVGLREEVASRHPGIDPSQVQVAVGTKHALHLALAAVAGPGDDVLVVQPSWPGHLASVTSVGAATKPVPVGRDGLVDVAALCGARTPCTRAVVLANPSNPTGAVHPPARVREIARWCLDHDAWLVSDEVYGGLVFDGDHASALETVPDTSRLLVVDGVSKVHAMTGWRVGWLIGTPEVVASARQEVSATITHVPLVTQYAALAALRDPETPVRAVADYRVARDLLVDRLRSIPGVLCPPPAGGMFAFPDVSGLLATGRWRDTTELAAWLLDHALVAVVPGAVFGADEHLRISFAIGFERLAAAADRVVRALTTTEEP